MYHTISYYITLYHFLKDPPLILITEGECISGSHLGQAFRINPNIIRLKTCKNKKKINLAALPIIIIISSSSSSSSYILISSLPALPQDGSSFKIPPPQRPHLLESKHPPHPAHCNFDRCRPRRILELASDGPAKKKKKLYSPA